MFRSLRHRQREEEWLDDPKADPHLLHESLRYIQRINRLMGYTRLVIQCFEQFCRNWQVGQRVNVVDVGSGSADIPAALVEWGRSRNFDVRVTAVDLNPVVAAFAADEVRDSRVTLVQADAMNLPFPDGSFDYAITSMFLHHLDESQAERALAEMNRVASQGVVVSDLLRKSYAYAFIWLATMFSNPMVKHDARVSVAQSFSRDEIRSLCDKAGLTFARYRGYRFHRYVIAGERTGKIVQG